MNAYHHYEDYADLLAFRAKKAAFKEEINNLWAQYHAAKSRAPGMAPIIEEMINKQVEEWNVQNPKGPTYLDLHGMSVQGARDYVARMVKGSGKKWLLEVGQGNNSWDGVPKIKMTLLEEYGVNIEVHHKNKGLLFLDFRPKWY